VHTGKFALALSSTFAVSAATYTPAFAEPPEPVTSSIASLNADEYRRNYTLTDAHSTRLDSDFGVLSETLNPTNGVACSSQTPSGLALFQAIKTSPFILFGA
jgi:hypothetical protein